MSEQSERMEITSTDLLAFDDSVTGVPERAACELECSEHARKYREGCQYCQANIVLCDKANVASETGCCAGECTTCGGPVFHRDGKPGEYDHECGKKGVNR